MLRRPVNPTWKQGSPYGRGSSVEGLSVANNGLVRFFPMGMAVPMGGRLEDTSQYGQDMLMHVSAFGGSPWAAGVFGGVSLTFPGGTTGGITQSQVAKLHLSGQDFTVMAWYYPSTVSGLQFLFTEWNGADATGPAMFTESATVTFEVGGYANKLTTGSVLSANTWVHLAFVCYGTGSPNLSIYVNGVLNTGPTSRSRVTTTAPTYMSFGSGPAGFSVNNFSGRIDAARVYKRALSDAEIKFLFLNPFAGVFFPVDRALYGAAAASSFIARQGLNIQQAVNRASTF